MYHLSPTKVADYLQILPGINETTVHILKFLLFLLSLEKMDHITWSLPFQEQCIPHFRFSVLYFNSLRVIYMPKCILIMFIFPSH